MNLLYKKPIAAGKQSGDPARPAVAPPSDPAAPLYISEANFASTAPNEAVSAAEEVEDSPNPLGKEGSKSNDPLVTPLSIHIHTLFIGLSFW